MSFGKEWTSGVAAGATVGVLAGAVAGWIGTTIGGWVVATEKKHWWEVASAISTTAAVIVALGTAWFAQRKEARVKRREGEIVAAQLSTSLPPIIRSLERAVKSFRVARDGPHESELARVGHVQDGYLHLAEVDLQLPDLGALAWADEKAAHLIAKAIGSIRHIRAHPLGPITPADQMNGIPAARYYRVARHATEAAEWLEAARKKCSKRSKIKYRVQDEWRLPRQDVCGYVPDED